MERKKNVQNKRLVYTVQGKPITIEQLQEKARYIATNWYQITQIRNLATQLHKTPGSLDH